VHRAVRILYNIYKIIVYNMCIYRIINEGRVQNFSKWDGSVGRALRVKLVTAPFALHQS